MSSPALEHFSLENGLEVILENIPYRNSVSAGIWVPVGSRCEDNDQMGYSHFTEHMLFKGTETRTYKDIALAIDRLGGNMNASTSKELTNYYITLSPKFVDTALDILSDIFLNSMFPKEEFKVEQKVILEEIKMGQDSPDDLLFDIFFQDFFGDTPLGRPIAGTSESIASSTQEKLQNYYYSKYGVKGSVLSIAGGLWSNDNEFSSLRKKIEKYFQVNKSPLLGEPRLTETNLTSGSEQILFHHHQKELEQVHFTFGLEGLSEVEKGSAYLDVFTHLMGGTMSSRLFRKLREENGLCYSVGSFNSRYMHEGIWGVYCGTSQEMFLNAVELMMKEIKAGLNESIPEEEVEQVKSGMCGSIELAMESPFCRANFNAKSLIYYSIPRDWREKILEIEQVTSKSLTKNMSKLWEDRSYILTSLGSMDPKQTEKELSEYSSQNFFFN